MSYATSANFGSPRGSVKSLKSLFTQRCHGSVLFPPIATYCRTLRVPSVCLVICESCVQSVCLVPQITHSPLMKSDRKLVPALRLLRCRSADIRLRPLHIRLASKSLRKISCRRGRNIRAGTCSPPCGSDTRILGFAADLIQTARAICDRNWFGYHAHSPLFMSWPN